MAKLALRRRSCLVSMCATRRRTTSQQAIFLSAFEALHGAVGEMFAWLRGELAAVIVQGQQAGELRSGLDPARVAATIAATLQGGYVLARAAQDASAFDAAVDGVLDPLALVTRAPDADAEPCCPG